MLRNRQPHLNSLTPPPLIIFMTDTDTTHPFRMKFLLRTWRSSLVDATTSNFQKMREKNLPKPLKKDTTPNKSNHLSRSSHLLVS